LRDFYRTQADAAADDDMSISVRLSVTLWRQLAAWSPW